MAVGAAAATPPPADWSPLKCSTNLIVHPLMTGYFARSVIVILHHMEEGPGGSSETKEGGGIDEGGVGGFGGGEGKGGGTYGLIVNRLALRDWRTPRGGSLTYSVGTGRRRDRGGWRRWTAAAAAGGSEGMATIHHDVPPNN